MSRLVAFQVSLMKHGVVDHVVDRRVRRVVELELVDGAVQVAVEDVAGLSAAELDCLSRFQS